jgi:hypothetical protein
MSGPSPSGEPAPALEVPDEALSRQARGDKYVDAVNTAHPSTRPHVLVVDSLLSHLGPPVSAD